MSFSFDPRTRFPLLQLREGELETGAALALGQLPVTKVQFEMFLATAPAGFGSTWYETVLALNGRISANRFVPERREGLWMTGLTPDEALAFCRWIGDGFDLPTADEWRAIDKHLRQRGFKPADAEKMLNSPRLHPAAKVILEKLVENLTPKTVGDMLLLTDGIFEWVHDAATYRGLGGRTRPEFLHSIYNPQANRPVKHFGERSGYFGFRVVRRGRPMGAGG